MPFHVAWFLMFSTPPGLCPVNQTNPCIAGLAVFPNTHRCTGNSVEHTDRATPGLLRRCKEPSRARDLWSALAGRRQQRRGERHSRLRAGWAGGRRFATAVRANRSQWQRLRLSSAGEPHGARGQRGCMPQTRMHLTSFDLHAYRHWRARTNNHMLTYDRHCVHVHVFLHKLLPQASSSTLDPQLRGLGLTGTLPGPAWLSGAGAAGALTWLDLSGNSLTGNLPPGFNLMFNASTAGDDNVLLLGGNRLSG